MARGRARVFCAYGQGRSHTETPPPQSTTPVVHGVMPQLSAPEQATRHWAPALQVTSQFPPPVQSREHDEPGAQMRSQAPASLQFCSHDEAAPQVVVQLSAPEHSNLQSQRLQSN